MSSEKAESIFSFASAARNATPGNPDSVDSAGKTILDLIQRAAGMAKENSQHALDVAHKLSLQLQAAEDRIKDLESDVRHYQDRAERAEKWLYQISVELEQRFLGSPDNRRPQAPPPQALLHTYRRKS